MICVAEPRIYQYELMSAIRQDLQFMLTAIANNADVLILQADFMIPLRAVQNVALEVVCSRYADLVWLNQATSTANKHLALLHEALACLAISKRTPPSFCLILPSCVDPLCVQCDMLVDSKLLCCLADVLENLWLFGEDL